MEIFAVFAPRIHTTLMHKPLRLKRRIVCVETCGTDRHAVAQLVAVPRYKPEVLGFYSQWGVVVIFHLINNPYDRAMALGSTQTLTEMSSRSISWG
jgi:predicted metallopeptidase